MLIRFPGCTFCRCRVLSRTAARREQDGLQGVYVCSRTHRSSAVGSSPKISTLSGHQHAPSRVLAHGSTRAHPSPSARPAARGGKLSLGCVSPIQDQPLICRCDTGFRPCVTLQRLAFSSFLMRTSPTFCSLPLLSFYSVIRIDIVDRKF